MIGVLVGGVAAVWSHKQVGLLDAATADFTRAHQARRTALDDAAARLTALKGQLTEAQWGLGVTKSYDDWRRQQTAFRDSIVRLRENISSTEPTDAWPVAPLPTLAEGAARARVASTALAAGWADFEKLGSGVTTESQELAGRKLLPLITDDLAPALATLVAVERADADHVSAALAEAETRYHIIRLAAVGGFLFSLGLAVSVFLRRRDVALNDDSYEEPPPESLVAAAMTVAEPEPTPAAVPARIRTGIPFATATPVTAVAAPPPVAVPTPLAPTGRTRPPIPTAAPFGKKVKPVPAAVVNDLKRKAADTAPGIPIILLAEPAAVDGEILSLLLKNAGFAVINCDDGPKAHAAVTSIQFSVLVLNQTLPGSNGLEVLREARQVRSDIPAVFLANSDADAQQVEADGQSYAEIIRKPVNPRHLMWRISEILHPGENRISRDYSKPEPLEDNEPPTPDSAVPAIPVSALAHTPTPAAAPEPLVPAARTPAAEPMVAPARAPTSFPASPVAEPLIPASAPFAPTPRAPAPPRPAFEPLVPAARTTPPRSAPEPFIPVPEPLIPPAPEEPLIPVVAKKSAPLPIDHEEPLIPLAPVSTPDLQEPLTPPRASWSKTPAPADPLAEYAKKPFEWPPLDPAPATNLTEAPAAVTPTEPAASANPDAPSPPRKKLVRRKLPPVE